MTDDSARKGDSPLVVFIKLATEDRADVWLQPTALEQDLQAGRDNVMLDIHALRFVFRRQKSVAELFKHFRQTFIEVQLRAEFF